jgi:hypothetical protein
MESLLRYVHDLGRYFGIPCMRDTRTRLEEMLKQPRLIMNSLTLDQKRFRTAAGKSFADWNNLYEWMQHVQLTADSCRSAVRHNPGMSRVSKVRICFGCDFTAPE